jgi:hypothetical protein
MNQLTIFDLPSQPDPPPSLPPPKARFTRSQELRLDWWNGQVSFFTQMMTKAIARSIKTKERIQKGKLTERELMRWNRGDAMRRANINHLDKMRSQALNKIKEIEDE